MEKILAVSQNTVVNWKREQRPIIKFLEQYFDDEDIEEYLRNGSLKWVDYVKQSDFSKLRIIRDIEEDELREIFEKARKFDMISELLTPFVNDADSQNKRKQKK